MAAGGCIGCLWIQILGVEKPCLWRIRSHGSFSAASDLKDDKKIWKFKPTRTFQRLPILLLVLLSEATPSEPQNGEFHFTCWHVISRWMICSLQPLFWELGYQTSTATHAPDIGKWVAGPLGRLGSGSSRNSINRKASSQPSCDLFFKTSMLSYGCFRK